MASEKILGLWDYNKILTAHEQEYRKSRGPDRIQLVNEIMQEMVTQSKGTLNGHVLKGLDQMSFLVQLMWFQDLTFI